MTCIHIKIKTINSAGYFNNEIIFYPTINSPTKYSQETPPDPSATQTPSRNVNWTVMAVLHHCTSYGPNRIQMTHSILPKPPFGQSQANCSWLAVQMLQSMELSLAERTGQRKVWEWNGGERMSNTVFQFSKYFNEHLLWVLLWEIHVIEVIKVVQFALKTQRVPGDKPVNGNMMAMITWYNRNRVLWTHLFKGISSYIWDQRQLLKGSQI